VLLFATIATVGRWVLLIGLIVGAVVGLRGSRRVGAILRLLPVPWLPICLAGIVITVGRFVAAILRLLEAVAVSATLTVVVGRGLRLVARHIFRPSDGCSVIPRESFEMSMGRVS